MYPVPNKKKKSRVIGPGPKIDYPRGFFDGAAAGNTGGVGFRLVSCFVLNNCRCRCPSCQCYFYACILLRCAFCIVFLYCQLGQSKTPTGNLNQLTTRGWGLSPRSNHQCYHLWRSPNWVLTFTSKRSGRLDYQHRSSLLPSKSQFEDTRKTSVSRRRHAENRWIKKMTRREAQLVE